MAILSFSHPILMRCWRARALRNDAMMLKEVLKQMRHILTLIVKTKDFDLGWKLGQDMCMKNLKNRKYFVFRMEEINPCETAIVVNKSDRVFVISMRSDRCHTPHITMYQIERLDYVWCVNRKVQSFTFAKSARIAIKLNNTKRWWIFISKKTRFQ